MGIYIYLDVSFSVTREEWEAVYLETLELVNVFPLCEVVRILGFAREEIRTIRIICIVHIF